jgi:hypothetical protein
MEDREPREYVAPVVIDYGTLAELTATNGNSEAEDGVGKSLNTDGSNGSVS